VTGTVLVQVGKSYTIPVPVVPAQQNLRVYLYPWSTLVVSHWTFLQLNFVLLDSIFFTVDCSVTELDDDMVKVFI